MDSIIKRDRKDVCFLCGYCGATERHHIFGGNPNRKKSEKYGLVVHLCHYCHNEAPNGVHQNADNALTLHRIGQYNWETYYKKSTADFIAEFGKNYL